jgi:hypothetical protein
MLILEVFSAVAAKKHYRWIEENMKETVGLSEKQRKTMYYKETEEE